jgi:hypothetical protein
MTEVIVTKSINIPASIAWDMLSSFKGIEAFSPIEKSVTVGEGAGAKRTCTMPDGAVIHEVLDRVESQDMEMQYSITEGPFPITGYVSTVKVSTIDANHCKISWGCEFESSKEVEPQMIELFEGFYHVIIDSLETLVKQNN